MADYRLHAKIIGRSTGQSVVAAAAYRSGERILDERTGVVKGHTRESGILDTLIPTPANAPEWLQTRARLWNDVEHREDKSTRRSTAQLAREITISLPHELTHEQRIELACDFVKKEFVEHGVVADIAIHAPPKRGDGRNHHAHILLTLREVGPEGFGKKARLWEQQLLSQTEIMETVGRKSGLLEWRRLWAVYENVPLKKITASRRALTSAVSLTSLSTVNPLNTSVPDAAGDGGPGNPYRPGRSESPHQSRERQYGAPQKGADRIRKASDRSLKAAARCRADGGRLRRASRQRTPYGTAEERRVVAP